MSWVLLGARRGRWSVGPRQSKSVVDDESLLQRGVVWSRLATGSAREVSSMLSAQMSHDLLYIGTYS